MNRKKKPLEQMNKQQNFNENKGATFCFVCELSVCMRTKLCENAFKVGLTLLVN